MFLKTKYRNLVNFTIFFLSLYVMKPSKLLHFRKIEIRFLAKVFQKSKKLTWRIFKFTLSKKKFSTWSQFKLHFKQGASECANEGQSVGLVFGGWELLVKCCSYIKGFLAIHPSNQPLNKGWKKKKKKKKKLGLPKDVLKAISKI